MTKYQDFSEVYLQQPYSNHIRKTFSEYQNIIKTTLDSVLISFNLTNLIKLAKMKEFQFYFRLFRQENRHLIFIEKPNYQGH